MGTATFTDRESSGRERWVMGERRQPEELSEEERARTRRALQRLRNASQALEALTVVERQRGRWVPTPAPPGALDAAWAEFHEAYQEVGRVLGELLGWPPPDGSATT